MEGWCQPLFDEPNVWRQIREAITSIENRVDVPLKLERKDAKTPASDERFCSSFRTPSLRNVAVQERFGHNGVYKTLREVVAFYAHRAVAPDRVYLFDRASEKSLLGISE